MTRSRTLEVRSGQGGTKLWNEAITPVRGVGMVAVTVGLRGGHMGFDNLSRGENHIKYRQGSTFELKPTRRIMLLSVNILFGTKKSAIRKKLFFNRT